MYETRLFTNAVRAGVVDHIERSGNEEGGILFDLEDDAAAAKGARLAEEAEEDVDDCPELEERLRAKQMADWIALVSATRDNAMDLANQVIEAAAKYNPLLLPNQNTSPVCAIFQLC